MTENSCNNCKYADWEKTKNGSLHPNKQGKCKFVWTPPPLPKAYSFPGFNGYPSPSGGWIDRGAKACKDCPCFVATVEQLLREAKDCPVAITLYGEQK
jgi:hypothetical protein